MNKKWVLILVFMLILTGCARTKVIKLDQETPIVATQPVGDQTIQQQTQQIQQTTETPQQTVAERTASSSSPEKETIPVSPGFNPADEYTIISCCDEGRLYAQTKKQRGSYNQEEIKQILLNIYYANCDKFDIIREMIYLRYFNEIYDSNYLQHYKNTTVRKVLFEGNVIDQTFRTCT